MTAVDLNLHPLDNSYKPSIGSTIGPFQPSTYVTYFYTRNLYALYKRCMFVNNAIYKHV